jgi:hypothetical protein
MREQSLVRLGRSNSPKITKFLYFPTAVKMQNRKFCYLGPGWPDWANFCLLGDYFLWVVFVKITEVAQIIGLRFWRQQTCRIFWQKMDWATFWATLSKTHLVTLFGTTSSKNHPHFNLVIFISLTKKLYIFWRTGHLTNRYIRQKIVCRKVVWWTGHLPNGRLTKRRFLIFDKTLFAEKSFAERSFAE